MCFVKIDRKLIKEIHIITIFSFFSLTQDGREAPGDHWGGEYSLLSLASALSGAALIAHPSRW